MAQTIFRSPIGPILLRSQAGRLTALSIGLSEELAEEEEDPLLREAASQLGAWFEGRLTRFELPLAEPTTPRGAAHRDAIASIPFGETASYGALARALGSSPRAVGQACRRNPLPIVIPCHRVIGANGTIGHYSGGQGIATKLWLLNHEQSHAQSKG